MVDATLKDDQGDLLHKLMEEMKELREQNTNKIMEELKELRAQNEEFRKIIAQQAAQLKKVGKGTSPRSKEKNSASSPQSKEKNSVKKELNLKVKMKAGDRKRKRPSEKAMRTPIGSKAPKELALNKKKLVEVSKTHVSLLDALSSPSSAVESPKKYADKTGSSPTESPRKPAKKVRRLNPERSKSENISPELVKDVERQVKKKSSPQNKAPEQQKVPSSPLVDKISPTNLNGKPSALEMVAEVEKEPICLPKVELQMDEDGYCPLCGQEYCNCSDDEMDFGVSAEESPEKFQCEMCTYSTSKKEYYLNHVANCDYSGQKAIDEKVITKKKKELRKDNIRTNYKKYICKHFMKTGKCQFGNACKFKHGEEDTGGVVSQQLFPATETPIPLSPQHFPLTQTPMMRNPILYPQVPVQNAPYQQNNPQFAVIPRQGKNNRPIYDRDSILEDPGVLFLSNISPKSSDKILLGALRAHLGGKRLELKNHVEINGGCAVVCFKDPELATQLINSLPFAVFNQNVEVTQGGMPHVAVPSRPAPGMQPTTGQNWMHPRFANITPSEDQGVVLITGMPSRINSKFLLGALRRHFGGAPVKVSNRVEVKNGSALVCFKDPQMVDKLMNSLPLKVFEHVVKVEPRSTSLGDKYMDNPQWNVPFRGLPGAPDQGFNNRRVVNRYDTM